MSVTDRERARFDLFFRVVLASLALGQAGQRQRQRQEIHELTISSLLLGRIR